MPDDPGKHRNDAEALRRRQLIAATIDAIAEVGFAAATLAEIGQRAGVSPGLIAHYFSDKEGLLEATLRSLAARLAAATTARLRAARNPRERVQAVIEATLASQEFDPRSCGVWLAFWGQVIHSARLRRVQRVYQRRILSNLRHALRRMVPASEATPLAVALAAMIDGLWLRASLSAEGEIDAVTARAMATAFIDDAIARAVAREAAGDAAVDAAVAAAAASQPAWAARPAADRALAIATVAAALRRAGFDAAADNLAAGAGVMEDAVAPFGGPRRVPHGVVAAIVGAGAEQACAVAGPVLAAGNALVLGVGAAASPAVARLPGLLVEAGLPPGLLAVVPVGDGRRLLGHAGVDAALPAGEGAPPALLVLADGDIDEVAAIAANPGGIVLVEEPLRTALAARLPDADIRGFVGDMEAVALANGCGRGEVGVFTRDLVRAHRVVAALRAGDCWVNARPACAVDRDRYTRRRTVTVGVPGSARTA